MSVCENEEEHRTRKLYTQEGLYKDTKEEKINTIAKVAAIDFTVKNEK